MEIVRRRGAVRDLHVVLGAHLQKALEPCRRVLRALALVAVRQQADEPGHAQPFALAGRDELIEYDLRAVGEVAELGLPQRQGVRLGERIAVFETEHRLLGQHRIDDLVARLLRGHMIERRIAVLVLLVDQHRMALGERAALGVLAGQPDRGGLP